MPTNTRALAEQLSEEVERTAYQQRLEVFVASRDSGYALTGESLHAGIRLETLVDAAADLASYADEAIGIVKEEYRPRLHCREGCYYCCCKPGVLTSLPELLRIVATVRSKFSPANIAALADRTRRYVTKLNGRNFNDPTDESLPCPLLVDGRCSVYEVRPLVCRGYNSTDVDACRRAHRDATVLVPMFSIIKDVTDGTTVGAAQRLKQAGCNDSLFDLGTALDIALTADMRFRPTVLDDSTKLLPAENSTWVTELWTCVRQAARRVGIEI